MKFLNSLLMFLGLKKPTEEALQKLHTDALGYVEKAKNKIVVMEKVAEAHAQQAEQELGALTQRLAAVTLRRNTVQRIHSDLTDSLGWLDREEDTLEAPAVPAATPQVSTTEIATTPAPEKPDAPAS